MRRQHDVTTVLTGHEPRQSGSSLPTLPVDGFMISIEELSSGTCGWGMVRELLLKLQKNSKHTVLGLPSWSSG